MTQFSERDRFVPGRSGDRLSERDLVDALAVLT